MRKSLRQMGFNFISEESPAIFLYHHLFRRPFTKSARCNHFAYLFKVDNNHIEDDAGSSIYYGTASEKEKRTYSMFESRSSVSCSRNSEPKQSKKMCTKNQKGTILQCWSIEIIFSKKKTLNKLVSKYEAAKRAKDETMDIC